MNGGSLTSLKPSTTYATGAILRVNRPSPGTAGSISFAYRNKTSRTVATFLVEFLTSSALSKWLYSCQDRAANVPFPGSGVLSRRPQLTIITFVNPASTTSTFSRGLGGFGPGSVKRRSNSNELQTLTDGARQEFLSQTRCILSIQRRAHRNVQVSYWTSKLGF